MTLRSVASDQDLLCLPKSPKMPLDIFVGQDHLKVKGCQACFIFCKFGLNSILFDNITVI